MANKLAVQPHSDVNAQLLNATKFLALQVERD
jgi:hypothetical protein